MEGPFAELFDAQSICYVTVATGAAIMYDQILYVSQEVDFIWVGPKDGSKVLDADVEASESPLDHYDSTLLRGSLLWSRISARNSDSQPASSLDCRSKPNFCFSADNDIIITAEAFNFMFITAMQAILLLRAYVLCNRSKKVLAFLLSSFVCEMIAIVVVIGRSLGLIAMGGFVTFMGAVKTDSANSYALAHWLVVYRAIQLAFDILLRAIALFGSVKHTLEAKGWSVNPLVKALVADQIGYFVWYAVWQGTNLTTTTGVDAGVSALEALNYIFGGFAIIAGPRMVISLRARELKTREGTLQTELSTIQFNVRGSPSQLDAEEEPVHTHSLGSRREGDADA
ncbi:hypothetical protein BV22DRAFT_1135527 [Leucogyrophana mollusca]|uniref:Uncharacterized protein n=1 Tax=Leucogyrophana mollusca TaxID=85980 RepID=A0ACB8AVN3_9AGAM|nr:hypothetical protein BV22DRAFT_1135527 [Leucogyrophana mollusca]